MNATVLPVASPPGAKRISAVRVKAECWAGIECEVVEEDVLTIDVESVGTYSLMWTPTEVGRQAVGYTIEDGVLADSEAVPEALALGAGFAFTEGIVERRTDIAHMSVCPERSGVVRMSLVKPEGVEVRRRNVVMNSSCGVCGGREGIIESIRVNSPVGERLQLAFGDFDLLRKAMQESQQVFARTGGAHAAAIFDADLEVLAFAEDLGRHNALDKAIGDAFLRGVDLSGCGVFISSRISYEMVAKSVRAGFELIAAISAPSSLAIEIAERFGITLCGFVRGGSLEVYTCPHRIGLMPLPQDSAADQHLAG